MSPEGVVSEAAKGYRQKPEDNGRAGAGGSFLFVFEAVAPGETELRFFYERPWENEEPARTAVYILKVSSDGMITVKNL
jgi:predicted secreted protein